MVRYLHVEMYPFLYPHGFSFSGLEHFGVNHTRPFWKFSSFGKASITCGLRLERSQVSQALRSLGQYLPRTSRSHTIPLIIDQGTKTKLNGVGVGVGVGVGGGWQTHSIVCVQTMWADCSIIHAFSNMFLVLLFLFVYLFACLAPWFTFICSDS